MISYLSVLGFNVEMVQFEGSKFVTWDVSGKDKIVGFYYK